MRGSRKNVEGSSKGHKERCLTALGYEAAALDKLILRPQTIPPPATAQPRATALITLKQERKDGSECNLLKTTAQSSPFHWLNTAVVTGGLGKGFL